MVLLVLLLLAKLFPVGVISWTAGTILQVVLNQLALGVVQPGAPQEVVIIQLVQLLLLPQDLLLGLRMWLLLMRLLLLLLMSILLVLSGTVAISITIAITTIIILLVLIGLFLLGSLQYELHITGVFAPLHENFQRVLVGCQQPFVVSPSLDEGESSGFSGGMRQGKYHVLVIFAPSPAGIGPKLLTTSS